MLIYVHGVSIGKLKKLEKIFNKLEKILTIIGKFCIL
nr:MAG TPA: hypothetical protein [Caudoviricetes sp.]